MEIKLSARTEAVYAFRSFGSRQQEHVAITIAVTATQNAINNVRCKEVLNKSPAP